MSDFFCDRMSAGTEKQGEFMLAVEAGDRSLIQEALSVLDCAEGHYECYGETVGGAASCYLARMGTDENRATLLRELSRNEAALELSREGLWDEPEYGASLIVDVFELSNPEQRRDTLDILGIRLSEKDPVEPISEAIKKTVLSPAERRLLRKVIAESKTPGIS